MTRSPSMVEAHPPESSRHFHLDEDLLPDRKFYCRSAAFLNHGRSIVRNKAGVWFAAVVSDRGLPGGNWLTLHVSGPGSCSQGSQFPEPIFLFGPSENPNHPVLGGRDVQQVALALDASECLHVVVESDGALWRGFVDASGDDARTRLADPAAWNQSFPLMENARLGDALFDPKGRLVIFATRQGVLYEMTEGGAPQKIADAGVHPSAFVEDDGTLHVAFEQDRRVYYARQHAGCWSAPELVAQWCSSWPSLVVTNGQALIAYQGEGKVDLKRHPDLAGGLRPGGGSTISFARQDGARWIPSDYLRSCQILLKRKICGGLPSHDERFSARMEEFWRPSLSLDAHGVAWMFFINATRRHVYWARWQGESFGVHHEARGAYDCLSRIFFLQKDARGSDSIGYMTHAARRFYFDAIPVPDITTRSGHRIVFLDNLEVDSALRLEHFPCQWDKHPQPLFGQGLPGGAHDEQILWCDVGRVADGFVMRYMGIPSAYANSLPGRAFSPDGYHWEKQPTEERLEVTVDGKPVGTGFWHPVGLRDEEEANPQRRYKGLHQDWRYEEAGMVQTRIFKVVASPDGRAWQTVPEAPRVVVGDIVTDLQILRDDDDADTGRRYKIALCAASHSGRGMAVFTSPDLIHWESTRALRVAPEDLASPLSTFLTGPLAIDPDAAESPWEEETHDATLWREHGLLMFHYDALYFGGNQHTEKALAISRDGRHYWRILRGTINLPHGACGTWDSGRVRTGRPIRIGDEFWLWYAGAPSSDFSDPEDDGNSHLARLRTHAGVPTDLQNFRELRPWRVGMARLRAEGWACFRLQRDAEAGELITIPFLAKGGESLVVNGTGLGLGGLRIEVLDDTGQVVRGFSRDHCVFSKPDSVNARVCWGENQRTLPAGISRLRVVFEGLHARLFALGFE